MESPSNDQKGLRTDDWSYAPRATISEARKVTRLTRRLRIALPVLGIGVATVFVATVRPQSLSASPAMTALGLASGEDLMTSPTFLGADDDGRPFQLSAERAIRREASGRIELVQPEARQDVDGLSRAVVADWGAYHELSQELQLDGDVRLDLGDGHVFQTARATMKLEEGQVDGPSPVRGDGPMGSIAADRFEIRDDGAALRFEGGVRLSVDASALDRATGRDPRP